ncbi:ecotin, putative [Leishmania tarentolae]|uniref:Ecotin, putative n=1 Tax=Leishmania tarentolae TaxID=5689 RepID=A0A640KD64_LEITA|nr:ecotin, putative [Leishmania tarentolae]
MLAEMSSTVGQTVTHDKVEPIPGHVETVAEADATEIPLGDAARRRPRPVAVSMNSLYRYQVQERPRVVHRSKDNALRYCIWPAKSTRSGQGQEHQSEKDVTSHVLQEPECLLCMLVSPCRYPFPPPRLSWLLRRWSVVPSAPAPTHPLIISYPLLTHPKFTSHVPPFFIYFVLGRRTA